MDLHDDIEQEIRQLERDKKIEELKQLKAGAKTKWITPAALAALLPIFTGFGFWIVEELKAYNEGYKALAEREVLRQEKDRLQAQKDSLNIEVNTLLQLKTHYAEEAERSQRNIEAKQGDINLTYLRGAFTSAEALYALDHIKGLGPPPDKNVLNKVRQEIKQLPKDIANAVDKILRRSEMSHRVISISRNLIGEFANTLKLIPASDWTKELQSMPTGLVLPGRKIMVSRDGKKSKYYDVSEGRFLTAEEVKPAR